MKSTVHIYNPPFILQLGQDYFAYNLKKDLPFAFLKSYHAFKTWEGIVS